MTSFNWMGGSRQEKLDLSGVWLIVLNEETTGPDGKPVKKWVLWRVTREDMEKLGILHSAAMDLLTRAKDKGSRTEVLTQQLEEAFDALETFMREMRVMYFHNPPLTNADLVSLRLAPKTARPGRLGKPTATVAARAIPVGGYGELEVSIDALSGDLNARENRGGVFYKWGIFPPGTPAPTDHKQLITEHINTNRLKDRLSCGADKSGWDIYFCARIEQGDRKGEWGPITHAKIP